MAMGTNHGVTYEEMKERHKPKKTTDDCYTPDKVYEAVLDWVIKEYDLKDVVIERPFWPDKDYTQYDYKKNSVVVDNPPFSILFKIVKYYQENNIKFFLFAPALVLTGTQDASKIITRADVIYNNGEVIIPTDFLTNMEDEYLLRNAPDLKKAVEDITEEEKDKIRRKRTKNIWPDNLVTSARFPVNTPFGIKKNEATERISKLDSQKERTETKKKYQIYGGGVLVSDSAAARLKEARLEEERLKEARGEGAIVWKLSDREKEMIRKLDEGGQ